MAKKLSKRTLQVDHRGGRASRSSRSSASGTGQAAATRCPRGSPRATAGSRRSSSTSPPRSRCGSRRSSSTKALSSSRARCWCSWTPSRWRRELAEAKASVAAARGEAGGRQGVHRQAEERDRARRDRGRALAASSSRRAPARSASSTSARRRWRRPRPALAEAEAMLQTADAAGRGRAGERGDDPDAHRRRDAQVAGHGTSALSPGRSRARCSAPGGKALTLVNLEDVYMEIFLPVGAGRRA